jgi:hypothetical protein
VPSIAGSPHDVRGTCGAVATVAVCAAAIEAPRIPIVKPVRVRALMGYSSSTALERVRLVYVPECWVSI